MIFERPFFFLFLWQSLVVLYKFTFCFINGRDESISQKTANKTWTLKFQRSPVGMFSAPGGAKISGVRFEINDLVEVCFCQTFYYFMTSMQWRTCSLRKQLTFGDTTTGFPAKWCLRNERRNSMLMMWHYLDLGSASEWLKICFNKSQALPRSV